ncbi:MAG TPA: hypothetical protein VNM69_13290 [Bacillus sp. (in: firmicutes)]|nr:hypothetical protein [Bacillus sp. (in: firmicutes)]
MTEKKDYERMKGEIADLRCAIAGLIAENERLKTKIDLLEEGIDDVVRLVYKHVDDLSELYSEAERYNRPFRRRN